MNLSLYNVNKYSEELMGKNISNIKYSISLGVACHFINHNYS